MAVNETITATPELRSEWPETTSPSGWVAMSITNGVDCAPPSATATSVISPSWVGMVTEPVAPCPSPTPVMLTLLALVAVQFSVSVALTGT